MAGNANGITLVISLGVTLDDDVSHWSTFSFNLTAEIDIWKWKY